MAKYPLRVVIERMDGVTKYWSCGSPGHKHGSERRAAYCMSRKGKARQPGKPRSNEEKLKILARVQGGLTVMALAEELGISEGGAWRLVANAKRIERSLTSDDPFDRLSTRARTALLCSEIDTMEKVQAALEAGVLERTQYLGAKSKDEIVKWLRIEGAKQSPATEIAALKENEREQDGPT